MNIIIALLVFSVIIIVHEFGHFLLAKMNGITVVEFSLGMGPRLLSFAKRGTRYSWKLLPFGGSCMMLGEDGGEEGEGTFGSASVWARISVIAAGPLFNFILAFMLSVFIVGNVGYDAPVLQGVSEGSPAQEAGLQKGDRIIRMNGKRIRLYRQISNYVTFHQEEFAQGQPVRFEYERGGQIYDTSIVPTVIDGAYRFGIPGSSFRVRTGPIDTVRYSAYEVYYWIDVTIQSLGMLVHGGVSLNDMSGPVGVVDMIGETYEESRSSGLFYIWLNMMNIAILLTANLGVMNLLPIPALDGGRLVFLILEVIRRKKVDPETEARIHFAGLLLLMLLMVVIMLNDIKKILF